MYSNYKGSNEIYDNWGGGLVFDPRGKKKKKKKNSPATLKLWIEFAYPHLYF